jgi:hypothetical protein
MCKIFVKRMRIVPVSRHAIPDGQSQSTIRQKRRQTADSRSQKADSTPQTKIKEASEKEKCGGGSSRRPD